MGTKGENRKKAPEVTARGCGKQKEIPQVPKLLAGSQRGAKGRRGVAHLTGRTLGKALLLPLLPCPLPGPYLDTFCNCPAFPVSPHPSHLAGRRRRKGRLVGMATLAPLVLTGALFHQFSWGLYRHIHSHQAVCQQLPPV